MRALCSFAGGAGHLLPQMPLLREMAAAGHELTLIGRSSGAQAAPAGIFRRIVTRDDRRSSPAQQITSLLPVNREAEVDVVAQYFAGDAALSSFEAAAACAATADVVICDELDFGAMAAGAEAGIPVVVVSVIASGALVRESRVGDALRRLSVDLGLSAQLRLHGDLFVIPFAPRMRAAEFPPPPHTTWMRPDRGPEPHPNGSIVATLGTEFNTESGDLFDRILGALATLDVPAVVTIGSDLDASRFGRQPAHIRIERFVDLEALIPRASVVLHHGGSGMFMRSVSGGAPQIVFPMGADQPFTGDRVEYLGVGTVLNALTADSALIASAAGALMEDAATRARVLDLRAEALALPAPTAAFNAVQALVTRPH
ncbi:UDP:flavonoid glycosyltransferase YjiC (YdhE family) [Microbacterium endophyticum]|uniref:UDP:flavonoid glycosyltransferase YjiC (YdhE family) n=1 Tax=Microbacterium endophyticum TaxID=1526412 RepID=A0A7W4V561_9MICO|nr:glycosyltransferase [Microbacterium endophyticum]MBB2976475.1 UDP:flavonoid glycosyltransferase YjiC (YdhE family) [Microbacterium endophyticum]NIK35921.1 UDP:flavonoid glycosyltransferase YjiC (YdhE family) [Microbacterium endophyticum]